eukprot:4863493-Amphidinium_carterae.1
MRASAAEDIRRPCRTDLDREAARSDGPDIDTDTIPDETRETIHICMIVICGIPSFELEHAVESAEGESPLPHHHTLAWLLPTLGPIAHNIYTAAREARAQQGQDSLSPLLRQLVRRGGYSLLVRATAYVKAWADGSCKEPASR